jgi:hypothetical protein
MPALVLPHAENWILLGNAQSFKLLMRSCTGDVSARTCAGRMGDDIHVYVLTLGAIMFDDGCAFVGCAFIERYAFVLSAKPAERCACVVCALQNLALSCFLLNLPR